MKNLLTHLITLLLLVFSYTNSFGQEEMTVTKTNNPGFYEILSSNTDDLQVEHVCYLLNRKANMADYIDSETIIEFELLSILFFKTYEELVSYRKLGEEDQAKLQKRASKISVNQLPERLVNVISTQTTTNK